MRDLAGRRAGFKAVWFDANAILCTGAWVLSHFLRVACVILLTGTRVLCYFLRMVYDFNVIGVGF